MISLLLTLALAQAKPVKIVVIDTGINFKTTNIHMCDSGNADFTGHGFKDINGHGSNVSSIIENNAIGTNYCQVIVKYYHDGTSFEFVDALKYSIKLKPDIINISSGGPSANEIEKKLIIQALNKGITVVAAAGNNGMNLDKKCDYFPACYDKRIHVVGNLLSNGKRNPNSDYGKFVEWEIGTNIDAGGYILTGSSQAAAVKSGKLVRIMSEKK